MASFFASLIIFLSCLFCYSPAFSEIKSTQNNISQSDMLAKTATPQTTLSHTTPSHTRLGMKDFITTFLFLFLIIVCIFFFAWFLKRMGLSQGSGNQLIKIISTIAVGQKERISLIEVGGQQILIGISPGNIQKIMVLDTPLQVKELPTQHQLVGFSSQLAAFLTQKKQPHKTEQSKVDV